MLRPALKVIFAPVWIVAVFPVGGAVIVLLALWTCVPVWLPDISSVLEHGEFVTVTVTGVRLVGKQLHST